MMAGTGWERAQRRRLWAAMKRCQGLSTGRVGQGPAANRRALRGAFCVQALKPPSTVTVVPVICRAAGLARKATAAATSAGVP